MKAQLLNPIAPVTRAAAAAVVVAAALLSLSVAPAGAYTTPAIGSPGQLSFATTVSAQHYLPTTPSMILGATTVYPSPAYSGTQTVTVTYAIFSNAGGKWGASRSSTRFMQLAPGFRGTFPSLSFSGLQTYSGYKAMIVVEWRDPFGNLLGQRIVNYDGNLDYRCYSNDPRWARCTVYNNNDGWGAFVGFG